jgi:hypothetical protein
MYQHLHPSYSLDSDISASYSNFNFFFISPNYYTSNPSTYASRPMYLRYNYEIYRRISYSD